MSIFRGSLSAGASISRGRTAFPRVHLRESSFPCVSTLWGTVYNNNRTLEQRIKEHAKDKWYIGKDWMIEYVKLATRSEAEAFESHYISKYGTDKYYNKAKANWGINGFLAEDMIVWERYVKQEDNQITRTKISNSQDCFGDDFEARCELAIVKHMLLL